MFSKSIYRKLVFLSEAFSLVIFLMAEFYAAPGDLDPTFGSGGKLTDWAGSASGVAIQPDGKIMVVGTDYPTTDFRVARYNPDGTPDTIFGGGSGRVTTDFGVTIRDGSLRVVIQQDGKIIVAGLLVSANNGAIALARYNPDGSLDTTFGGGSGKVITPTPIEAYVHTADVAVQPNGKIVIVGGHVDFDGNYDIDGFLVGYDSDGSVDTSFGTGGYVSTEYNLASVILQSPNGKIVASGWSAQLARFNTNGSLDTDFGSGGIVTIPTASTLGATASDSVGNIVTTGGYVLFGITANGSLNSVFETPGFSLKSVVIQSDGKTVAAGWGYNGLNYDFALARYNLNGSLDNTFGGGDGTTTIDFNNSNDFTSEVVLDQHGRAVVVGESGGMFAIARVWLTDTPSIPFDFDGDGKADVSVFRPTDRTWYLNQSTNGFFATQFGLSTDKITPADFDGDGRTDITVYRDGIWYWLSSSNNYSFNARQFGIASDIPVPADFTGDGRAELAVYRNGAWWIQDLTNDQTQVVNFGISTDKPVPADYDGDGKVDQAIYRNGEWHLNRSSQGYEVIQFGLPSDKLVSADYDGDGKTDIAVFRDGIWYLLGSSEGLKIFDFGITSDIPVPADYDGDGRVDAAIYRNGNWWLRQSTSGIAVYQFGLIDDKPVQSAFLR